MQNTTSSFYSNINAALGSANAVKLLEVCIFTLATALAAQIRVPVPGSIVPMTLQTVVVLLAGLHMGAKRGTLSQALYLTFGALGVPLFASSFGGVAVLFGPTGGYLIGFVLAAALSGITLNWATKFFKKSWLTFFCITVFSSLMIFIPGLIQLKLFTGLSLNQTLQMGLYPFIIADLIKSALTASLATGLNTRR